MKKNFLMGMLMLLTVGLSFTACSNDDSVTYTPVSLSVEMPLGIENVEFTNSEATFTNVQTGEVFVVNHFVENNGSFAASIEQVPEGTYNVAITGDLNFTKDGVAGTTQVNQTSENVQVKSGSANVKLAVNTFDAKGGFVISEIFFAGTQTPENKTYTKDQYVVISNNSDVTLYADSIAFVQSAFLTTNKREYTPDLMNEYMSVDAIYMIPGTGKSVAVEPGKSLVLAVNAMDHREANESSFDLSKADYEFYDESTSTSNLDTNNPDVPDLDKWYCYTKSYYMLNNGGNKAYALAKMRQNKETYLAENYYDAKYFFAMPDGSNKEMKTSCYKLPNAWILDAVNLCPSSAWQWNVTSTALDAGYAYCGSTLSDKTRLGKSVIRKKENGKWVDTNNSSNDFEAATASFLQK